MTKIILSILCCAALGSVSAFAYETMVERTARELAKYQQTGEFEKCISHSRIKKTVILDDTKIIFEMKNRKYLLNTLRSECKSLGFDRKFSYSASGGKLCGKDLISTRLSTCNLGEFEILDKKS